MKKIILSSPKSQSYWNLIDAREDLIRAKQSLDVIKIYREVSKDTIALITKLDGEIAKIEKEIDQIS